MQSMFIKLLLVIKTVVGHKDQHAVGHKDCKKKNLAKKYLTILRDG